MTTIETVGTGLVYRNPLPHVRSIHAYFGSVTAISETEMVAAFDLGSAFEADDVQPHVARSTDAGETWALEGPIWPWDPQSRKSATCRIAAMPNGELLGIGARWEHRDPPVGLTNPETGGFIPTEALLARSADGGRTWEAPIIFEPPLASPSYEICATPQALPDGRWVIPMATWMDWDGDAPAGMKAILLFSDDQGRTWPEYSIVMDGWVDGVVYWESKLLRLADDRLLATAWVHNLKEGRDLPDHYALSHDGGRTFTQPRSTGLAGQTLTPFLLPDGRILCIYRGTETPGLRARVVRLDGEEWVNETETVIWGAQTIGMDRGRGQNIVDDMATLRFGFPCGLSLPNGDVYFVFWCYEDCVSNIRWFRLRVTG